MLNDSLSSIDFVIIGESIRSMFLAALLIKKNYHILILESGYDNAQNTSEEYSIVPLNFLRHHSIPYSERSLKNKSKTGFIERYINLEKYIRPKYNNNQNLIIRNRYQLGIVNHRLFNKFLNSLIEKETNLQIIRFGENISIDKHLTSNSKEFSLTIDSKKILLNFEKLIIADYQIAINLGISLHSPDSISYKYTFKINEILADSINHYFFVKEQAIQLISILPCSNFTIIELCSEQDYDDPLTEEFISFLQDSFDEPFEDLVLIHKEVNYKQIQFSHSQQIFNELRIIPDKLFFPFPFISNLYIALESIFIISSAIEANYYGEYSIFIHQIADFYSKFNLNFLKSSNPDFLDSFYKMMNGKDVSYINIISKVILQIKFKNMFKRQNLSGLDFKNFIRILSHSYILEK